MDKKITVLGLGTLLIFGLMGIFIIEQVLKLNFISVVFRGWAIGWQLVTGAVYGLLSAAVAWFIITRDFFAKERNYYREKISMLNLNYIKIIFISLCAGIGEEIFFRAALQPLLGIGLTSFIFVALHGYLNPFNWRISIYGLTMVVIMLGFGYLFKIAGLLSVIMAHTLFDIVLLKKITESNNR